MIAISEGERFIEFKKFSCSYEGFSLFFISSACSIIDRISVDVSVITGEVYLFPSIISIKQLSGITDFND